jgi:hypothetical protein
MASSPHFAGSWGDERDMLTHLPFSDPRIESLARNPAKWHVPQPTMQPIIRMTCTYLERLTEPSVTCKLLNV